MESREVAAELDKPLAGQLLRASPLLRLAYVSSDGTPRVVPVAFLWVDRRILVFTLPTSVKAKALARRPAVAITIDSDGLPPRALLIRGTARVETVDGVPQQYIDASLKTQSGRGSEDFAAGVEAMYDTMVKISIEPTWARLNDFETSLPRDVERVVAARGEAGDQRGRWSRLMSGPVPDEGTVWTSGAGDADAFPVLSESVVELLRSGGELVHPEAGDVVWDAGDPYELYLVVAGQVFLVDGRETGSCSWWRRATS